MARSMNLSDSLYTLKVKQLVALPVLYMRPNFGKAQCVAVAAIATAIDFDAMLALLLFQLILWL